MKSWKEVLARRRWFVGFDSLSSSPPSTQTMVSELRDDLHSVTVVVIVIVVRVLLPLHAFALLLLLDTS
jgi:hypothetical protein